MALKEDIKEIKVSLADSSKHIEVINGELGVIKNELKWHKWLMLVCLVLILALFGLNIRLPGPFLAGGLSILSFGLR